MPRRFDALRLSLLNWQQMWFDLEQLRRQRHFDNLLIDPDAPRNLLALTHWYEVELPDAWWALTMGNVRHWQSIGFELLSTALERSFNFHKRKFIDPRMELVPLARNDGNLPDEGESYRLIVEGREDYLIEDILALKAELAAVGWRGAGYAQGLRLDIHLYAPLLASEKIRIQPVNLSESEFRFVDDLRQWLLANTAALEARQCRLFLLRNLVRHGVGFFEAGNFYPDFILWCLNADGSQRIVFIDPHGLEHEGPGSDKIALAREIKKLEQRLKDPTVTLESAILSPGNNRMKVEHLWTMRGQARPDLAAMHVYFMAEAGYLDAVLGLATA